MYIIIRINCTRLALCNYFPSNTTIFPKFHFNSCDTYTNAHVYFHTFNFTQARLSKDTKYSRFMVCPFPTIFKNALPLIVGCQSIHVMTLSLENLRSVNDWYSFRLVSDLFPVMPSVSERAL